MTFSEAPSMEILRYRRCSHHIEKGGFVPEINKFWARLSCKVGHFSCSNRLVLLAVCLYSLLTNLVALIWSLSFYICIFLCVGVPYRIGVFQNWPNDLFICEFFYGFRAFCGDFFGWMRALCLLDLRFCCHAYTSLVGFWRVHRSILRNWLYLKTLP